MRNRPLNTRQKRFVENHVLRGMSIAESVRRAGYLISSGRSEDFSSWGCRLLKTPRVADEVKKLRDKVFAADALTFSEKRAFLARAVRCNASNPDPDLIQEIVETQGEHGSSRRVKVVSKLAAIEADNRMAGDNFADREPQANNPFQILIAMSSPNFLGVQSTSPQNKNAIAGILEGSSLSDPLETEVLS